MSLPRHQKAKPVFVAIVGGSGAGKSWLAERLQRRLGRAAVRLSVDDFYRDRSHLPPARRVLVNYDHPRAIDWEELRKTLERLAEGRRGAVPIYDFATHCRLERRGRVAPGAVVIVDGLWLLHRRWLRAFFGLTVFLDASCRLRLRRRLERDLKSRGRSARSVREQFQRMVEPMHRRFVQPQARHASVVVNERCGEREVASLAAVVRSMLEGR